MVEGVMGRVSLPFFPVAEEEKEKKERRSGPKVCQ
jgi:hypothetical protein